MMKIDFPKLIIRTPPDVKDWLVKRAARNGRSMTAELLNLMRDRMKADERSSRKADAANA